MTEGHLVTVLGVGALKRRKGYHIAIPAFAEVYAQFPGSRFIIVGDQRDAEYFSELRNLVAKYDLADAVEFRQDMDDADLGHLYDSATVFLLPSVNEGDHVEGFGLVFLEAAAHGVPAIGTKGNGISDAVIDGETGMLVAQENVMATAHALLTLLGDRGLRESMSRRSIEWARRNDWSTIAREYEQLYASISN
jgi:phosphatidylinositol alpha-1,6-mannosyltransferase